MDMSRVEKRMSELSEEIEQSDGERINVGSLKTFRKFVDLYPNIKYPAISLTPDNEVFASWKTLVCVLNIKFTKNLHIYFICNDRKRSLSVEKAVNDVKFIHKILVIL